MKQFYDSLIIFCFIFFMAGKVSAQVNSYDVKHIPSRLLENADAVVRSYEKTVDIQSPGEVKTSLHYAITILNKNGSRYAQFSLDYDKFQSIKSISGKIYDKAGNLVMRIKKQEIADKAYSSNVDFMDDDRYKEYDCNYAEYPFTCEFDAEYTTHQTLFLPSLRPEQGYNCSVEKAILNVSYPSDVKLRYATFHTSVKPLERFDNGKKQMVFELDTISAREKPDVMSLKERYPLATVILALDKFQIGDKEGNMSTWEAYGKFMYDLNANRDELPDNVKLIVHQMTDTCHAPFQKIKLLYNYLQKNTHYVGIQLGIGGWQTYDANYVATKGYGDCKALSNYMKALLKEVGIPSYQALVYASRTEKNPIKKDFPYSQFNHVILCVPLTNDSVWLECTSKTTPAGYLSSFTADRQVLLLTSQGGYITTTPAYREDVNTLNRHADMYIDSNDRLQGNIIIMHRGMFYDEESIYTQDQNKQKTEEHLNGLFALPSYNISSYKIEEGTNKYIPFMNEWITLVGAPNINRTMKRVFLEPDFIKLNIVSPSSATLNTSFQLHSSVQIIDTISISINGNYTPELIPSEVDIKYPFAEYHYKMLLEGGHTLKIFRYYKQNEGIYPSKLFSDYLALSKTINYGQDLKKVVLLKKE